MKYLQFTTICFLLFFTQLVFAQQKSIKASKQKTQFFYTSLNLQAGYFGEQGNMRWMHVNRSPSNQISFNYKLKRKRLLQKGYNRFIHLADMKTSVALSYDNNILKEGTHIAEGKLAIRDLWVKLATKWDRTSFKIGNFSLPFGHNPKVDPDYSLIPNIGGTDLGLSRDFGILFKTPVSKNLDIELSLTSGGLLSSPILSKQLIATENEDKSLKLSKISYHGDWLLTSRLGNSVFKKNEIGVFAITGKMTNASSPSSSSKVYRVGFDWIHKHKEVFRMTNQVLLGTSVANSGNSTFKVVQQSNAELFMFRQWIVQVTHNVQYTATENAQQISNHISPKNDYKIEGIVSAGIAYAVSPFTRLKINAFSNYNFDEQPNKMGLFFQLTTGLGLR